MLNKNVVNFLGCDAPYETSDIVLFGAPYDSTTSFRPGARFGPGAMRNESFGLETYSPYQDGVLTDGAVFDSGDLELSFGDSAAALEEITERTATILSDNKLPFMLGGEHLTTLGCVRAVSAHYADLHILHFDAHADLRTDYLGVKLSHACVMRRCYELLGDGRIHQFCIRSGDYDEWTFARAGHVDLHPFDFDGLHQTVTALGDTPIYLSVDLDCLDPSVFPGTGTPEAGGVSFTSLLDALLTVCSKAHVVGCDVNELAPMLDSSGASTAVACKVVREMLIAFLLKIERDRKRP